MTDRASRPAEEVMMMNERKVLLTSDEIEVLDKQLAIYENLPEGVDGGLAAIGDNGQPVPIPPDVAAYIVENLTSIRRKLKGATRPDYTELQLKLRNLAAVFAAEDHATEYGGEGPGRNAVSDDAREVVYAAIDAGLIEPYADRVARAG